MTYGIDFEPYGDNGNEDSKKLTPLTPEEQEKKDIASLLGELGHAEKILISFGCPEYRAINRQLAVMSDEKIGEIIANIPLRQAKEIQEHMDRSFIVGDVVRFKNFLDKRLANC